MNMVHFFLVVRLIDSQHLTQTVFEHMVLLESHCVFPPRSFNFVGDFLLLLDYIQFLPWSFVWFGVFFDMFSFLLFLGPIFCPGAFLFCIHIVLFNGLHNSVILSHRGFFFHPYHILTTPVSL